MPISSVRRVPGLSVSSISEELWKPALDEANGIFNSFTAGQIGYNQKFFVNTPFPLSGEREAATPIFRLGDQRTSQIERVVRTVFSAEPDGSGFGLENLEDLSRANVIVREYRPGQKIGFHTDDELCGPHVFGIVLENGRPDMGLILRKGSSGAAKSLRHVKYEDEYIMREDPGTIFLMEDQARYQWQHGLPPVPERRVSITVRFFKKGVDLVGLDIPYVENDVRPDGGVRIGPDRCHSATNATDPTSENAIALAAEDRARYVSRTVTLIKNNDTKSVKPLVIQSLFSTSAVGAAAKAKLRLKGNIAEYRYYLLFGAEVFDGDDVSQKHEEHVMELAAAQSITPKNTSSEIVIFVAEKNESYKGPQLKILKHAEETVIDPMPADHVLET